MELKKIHICENFLYEPVFYNNFYIYVVNGTYLTF